MNVLYLINFVLGFFLLWLKPCVLAKNGLEKDNPKHRKLSDKLDDKFGGNKAYDAYARPIIHGVYHAARGVGSGNDAEFARAKDQLKAVGTGQTKDEYLKAYKANEAKTDKKKK